MTDRNDREDQDDEHIIDIDKYVRDLASNLGLPTPPTLAEMLASPTPPRKLLEEMVEGGPTEEAERQIEDLTARKAACEAAGTTVGTEIPHKLQVWSRKLTLAKRRDELQATRRALGPEYAACWCLGLGGTRPYFVAIRSKRIEGGIGTAIPDGMTQKDLLVPNLVCSCPEGRAEVKRTAEVRAAVIKAFWDGQRQILADEARVPKRYKGMTLESWRDAVVARGTDRTLVQGLMDEIEYWHASVRCPWDPGEIDPETGDLSQPPRQTLVLGGDFGSGKSGLAAVLANRFLDNQRSVLYRKVPDLLAEVRAEFDHDKRALVNQQLVERASTVDLLVLDDLGAEKLTDANEPWVFETLYRILDDRHAEVRPTIITTNQSREMLLEQVGHRLFQRIVTDEASVTLLLYTPNLREAPSRGR
jgi:hypothetical protein